MALNIKNREVEELATEVARLAGESKTEAIRRALLDRKNRLGSGDTLAARRERAQTFLETQVWPHVLPEYLGKPMTKEEMDEAVGYGPEGY